VAYLVIHNALAVQERNTSAVTALLK